MPLDTTIAYQYRYGLSTTAAFQKLYSVGGLRRFYSGLAPAMLLGPLSRFGDTGSNAVVMSLLDSQPFTRDIPIIAKTMAGSFVAASWRVVVVPLDLVKTTRQVHGYARASADLEARIAVHGFKALWQGSSAAFLSTFSGHLPWYSTFNALDRHLPAVPAAANHHTGEASAASASAAAGGGVSGNVPLGVPLGVQRILRHGFMGFTASMVTDCCTNSLRVVKAIRQSEGLSYAEAARLVVREDGVAGLLGRGLKTRMLTNGAQGLVFTAVWKSIEEAILGELEPWWDLREEDESRRQERLPGGARPGQQPPDRTASSIRAAGAGPGD